MQPSTTRHLIIGLLLFLAVTCVYWKAPSNGFVHRHDDGDYVTENPRVKEGLSLEGMAWAFTHGHAANWHPLTWISHQVDVEYYGLNPRGHHVTNLVLHALNTLLLFLVLSRMTGRAARSGFVAALFAVHPLHVESVAWIAERKDVLSTFFMMLTLLAYLGYVKAPGWKRYLPVLLLFALGLLSKPMLVTLPFVLLLLDYWPLERRGLKKLVLEKVPLLALSAASCVVTMNVQKIAMQSFPFIDRLSNALVAYVKYILKTIWPADLAALYPHPEGALPLWQTAGAAAALILVTFLVLRFGRRHPFLPVGWFFYLGTLVPVIGIVQVGNQAMADRYTYIPLIGLFLMVGWGFSELAARQRDVLRVAAALVILVLMFVARGQVACWKDSATLFRHALDVVEDNYLAEHDLGMTYVLNGDPKEGLRHLNNAVRIKPDFGVAYANLAMIHCAMKEYDKAKKYARLSEKYGWKLPDSFLRQLTSSADPPGESR